MLHPNRPGWHVFTCLGCRWERGQKMSTLHTLYGRWLKSGKRQFVQRKKCLHPWGMKEGEGGMRQELRWTIVRSLDPWGCRDTAGPRQPRYVYCTTEHHRHPSLFSTGLHCTHCALHCIGSLHYTLEWGGPTKVYKQPGQARFSLNVTEWY